jgi:hypothetical protein
MLSQRQQYHQPFMSWRALRDWVIAVVNCEELIGPVVLLGMMPAIIAQLDMSARVNGQDSAQLSMNSPVG